MDLTVKPQKSATVPQKKQRPKVNIIKNCIYLVMMPEGQGDEIVDLQLAIAWTSPRQANTTIIIPILPATEPMGVGRVMLNNTFPGQGMTACLDHMKSVDPERFIAPYKTSETSPLYRCLEINDHKVLQTAFRNL